MARARHHQNSSRVISLAEYRHRRTPYPLRLSPEHDGLELLYANERHPDQLFALGILAWARFSDGSTRAMVPWLDEVVSECNLTDPLNGHWVGYRLPGADTMFCEAPAHKEQELETALAFFGGTGEAVQPQEFADTIGTHAIFADPDFEEIRVAEVISWRLRENGSLDAMVADPAEVTSTPVLPGDACLRPVQDQPDFRYFFQHHLANKLKHQDPETLAALAMLGSD